MQPREENEMAWLESKTLSLFLDQIHLAYRHRNDTTCLRLNIIIC